jgi:ATP-dependent exoDNAse (exonuclease V) beta subunit
MPDLLVDGPRVGLQLVRLDGGKATPTLAFEQLAEERRRAEAEEEDRILYVAMTRARERIVLSGAIDFERWPEPRQGGTPISWLGVALSAELPALALAGAGGWHDLPVGVDGAATVRCWLNTPATRAPSTPEPERASSPSEPDLPNATETRLTSPLKPAEPDAAERALTTLQRSIATLSYTSLSELERCGYRYYLERVLGLSEDRGAARAQAARSGAAARARGTLVHRLLETLDFLAPRPPEVEPIMQLAREQGMRLTGAEAGAIVTLIEAALEAPLALRIGAAVELRREHPFAFAIAEGEPLVTGVVDLLAREPDGGCMVIDYKSDQVSADAELEAVVEHEYAVQRLIYALAVLREGAAHVEVVHWFLERPHEPVHVRYAASERQQLEQTLQTRLARARERGFAVSSEPHRGLCLTCPGRGGLCSWDESLTLRESATTTPPITETAL